MSSAWAGMLPLTVGRHALKYLVVLCYSSQMMTNLRNLCNHLMNTLNPFSDDCLLQIENQTEWLSYVVDVTSKSEVIMF